MSNKLKVSIIVPVYNAQKYIEKCINSIVKQTYTNLEILLIDDGSKDKSAQICDLFATKDKRIKVFHIQNQGVSNARNIGLKNMTGEYVFFIDSDDFLDSDAIEILIQNLEHAEITKLGYKYIEQNEVKRCVSFNKIINCDDYIKEILFGNAGGHCWGYLINKSTIRNIFFDENTSCMEDTIFIIKCIKNVEFIKLVDSSFYNYVFNSDSITSSNKNIKLKIMNYFYSIDKIDMLLNNKFSDDLLSIKSNLLITEFHKIKSKFQLKEVISDQQINDALYIFNQKKPPLYIRVIIKLGFRKLYFLQFLLIRIHYLIIKTKFYCISKIRK